MKTKYKIKDLRELAKDIIKTYNSACTENQLNGKLGGRPNLKYSIESTYSPEGWDDQLGIFSENSSVLNSKKEAIKALARAKREARNRKYSKKFIASLTMSTFDQNEFDN
jgi:hypothetical protein